MHKAVESIAPDLTASRSLRGGSVVRALFVIQLMSCVIAGSVAQAAGISATDAWTPPNSKLGSDALLGMVLKNESTDEDALLRVSCPVATFSEKRQIDTGEGSKSAREVRSILIPSNSSLTLDKDHFHIALLQITNTLAVGQEFVCSLSFRHGGKIQVPVKVLEKAPGR